MKKQMLASLTQNPVGLGVGIVIVLAGAYWLTRQAVKDTAAVAGGIVSGDNVLTRNQTNAAGEKVTAYQGAGVAGTLGAAANSASGGTFASWGEGLSEWFFNKTHDDPMAQPPAPAPAPIDFGGTDTSGPGGWSYPM